MTVGASYYPGEGLGAQPSGSGSVASLSARMLAFVLDGLALYLTTLLDGPGDDVWTSLAAFLLVEIVPSVNWGATVGQAVVGLRVVPYIDGQLLWRQQGLTVLTAVARALVWGCFPISHLIAVVTLDRDRRTLWDRLSHVVVVNR